MSDPRDDLAALVASRRGVTARVNDNDRETADRIIAAGWRNFAVYRTETERNVDTVLAIASGGKPVAIVADRLCYWTGTEWKWAEH